MHAPQVAVVVRTKNRPAFLRRALESIASQTFADWECIVVNDGGDPGAVDELIASLPESHRGRVRALHSEHSRGRWVSANAGVLGTTAPYLVLHDDDDTWHPEFLERAVGYLDANTDRMGVVSRIEILWETQQGDAFVTTDREMFQPQLAAPTLGDTLLFNRFVPIGFLYRRALHEELGLYDDRLPVVGDWNFNLQVLARHELEYLSDTPYAYWHQRRADTSADGNSVVALPGAHAKHDALIRDRALREYVGEHGMGALLYLTKFIDQRFVDVENGIRAEIRAANVVQRGYDKVRRVIRRRRG